MTQAKLGDTVRVHYTGKLEDGTVFDSSEENEPMELTLGNGTVIPGLEQGIVGMTPGEEKTEWVPCDMAYGPYQEDLTVEVDRVLFLEQQLVPEPGLKLQVTGSDGQQLPVVVTEVSDTKVTLDANHPLAGKDLIFDIALVEVA
ncbi:MAG TPA: peptidylprolyl isomerase [Nitrospiraceae bacterium]|jgi:peptidylprolyl isomerase|nr:peptidylprolyl isomerase [Nitrospiraceae bacterium]